MNETQTLAGETATRRTEPEIDPAAQDARADAAVLGLLLYGRGPGVWSESELVREIGDRVQALDSLSRLERAGLVHRGSGFVFASRSAVACSRIEW